MRNEIVTCFDNLVFYGRIVQCYRPDPERRSVAFVTDRGNEVLENIGKNSEEFEKNLEHFKNYLIAKNYDIPC